MEEISDDEFELLRAGPSGDFSYADWNALLRRALPLMLEELRRNREVLESVKRDARNASARAADLCERLAANENFPAEQRSAYSAAAGAIRWLVK